MRTNMRIKLMEEAKKHLAPLKFVEFKCPICGGIATVNKFMGVITAECHACSCREKANG